MMACMDGNDSLKRVARRKDTVDEDGNYIQGGGTSREREDNCRGGGDYFIGREEVNRWDREAMKETTGDEAEDPNKSTPCSEH
jgi:hypothetical protein